MMHSTRTIGLLYPLAGIAALSLGMALVLALSVPREWPMVPESVKARQVELGSQEYALVEGDPINCLGQIQGIEARYDPDLKSIIVRRYIIRWHPFTRVTVNNQWPVLYPVSWLPPGKYDVLYETRGGLRVGGSVTVKATTK